MKRISKATARKMWNNGENFIMVPCKLSPKGLSACFTRCDLSNEWERSSFDALVNEFTFYNCTRETGPYVAFYLEE